MQQRRVSVRAAGWAIVFLLFVSVGIWLYGGRGEPTPTPPRERPGLVAGDVADVESVAVLTGDGDPSPDVRTVRVKEAFSVAGKFTSDPSRWMPPGRRPMWSPIYSGYNDWMARHAGKAYPVVRAVWRIHSGDDRTGTTKSYREFIPEQSSDGRMSFRETVNAPLQAGEYDLWIVLVEVPPHGDSGFEYPEPLPMHLLRATRVIVIE
ncbi:MAG: hypothetical protein KF774_06305 [Planctomyces sp.]|nr:hypothetical protein [Planctomyces sp.]